MTQQIDLAGATAVGDVHEKNEDQFFIASLDKVLRILGGTLTEADDVSVRGNSTGYLALVADGVGGAANGEVASRVASETAVQYVMGLMPWFYGLDRDGVDDLSDHMQSALTQCQTAVHRLSDAHPDGRMMATTLTMAYIIGERLYVVHAGDSRCYLVRDGSLYQLTTDHTLAQKMVEQGAMDDASAQSSRYADILSNVIGGGIPGVDPEVRRANIRLGDTLMLCTDGLTDYVTEETITDVLRAKHTAEEQCGELIDAANAAGLQDDVTVVVGRILEM